MNSCDEAVVCSQCFLRSSSSLIFFKKGVLKKFANVTGKHAWIKTPHRCFHVKFAKFLNFFFTSETKHIWGERSSAVDLIHIRIENLDWCKCGHCKSEAREMDCFCCREVDAMLITSPNYRSARETSLHAAFIGNCRTLSHTY